nr:hypothetical protein [Lachnospiraceae bacterium]
LFTVLINEGVFGAVSVTVFYVISCISLFAALRGKRADSATTLRGKNAEPETTLRSKGADAAAALRGKGAGSVTTFSAFVALTALLAIWGISFPTVCSLPLLLLLIGV